MPSLIVIALIYLGAVSLLTAVVFTVDKINAVAKARRVPEFTLLFLAAIGGAATEYILMFTIRHKTRKAKFYVTLPLLVLIHGAVFALLWYFASRTP